MPFKSKQLKGLNAAVVSVTNMLPGKQPTAVFKITNGDGTAVDGTKLATFSPILAGPTSNYGANFRENAITKGVFSAAAGTTTYTFTAADAGVHTFVATSVVPIFAATSRSSAATARPTSPSRNRRSTRSSTSP